MKKPTRIEIVKVDDDWYHVRIRSPNGRLHGHQYNSKRGAKRGVLSLVKALRGWFEIVEV